MSDPEIEKLRQVVLRGEHVIWIPRGLRVVRVVPGPKFVDPSENEPSDVAYMEYPPTDYVALYNCELSEFGVVTPIT